MVFKMSEMLCLKLWVSFFEPFFGVSMVYDAFIDVLPREGITSFGVGRGGVNKIWC